ncbi:hypothetical protein [Desulfosediminicola sp.]|uniref:hypothetical protein n=1 Tax=Desulfosediminicola sp. TaxID=2886825 RepID=UPI003AF2AD2B
MSKFQAWWIGFLIIVIFVFLSEGVIVFKDYVFSRLGLDRNLVLVLLWLLPVLAGFTAVFLSKKIDIAIGLSYIPIITVLGPFVHFLSGELGATIDFSGLAGLKVTFPIYLVLGSIVIGIGSLAGVTARRIRK